jgi:hypothetical protein
MVGPPIADASSANWRTYRDRGGAGRRALRPLSLRPARQGLYTLSWGPERTPDPVRTSSRGRRLFSRRHGILLLCLQRHGTYRLLAVRAFVVRPYLVAFSAHCHPHWPTTLGTFGPHNSYHLRLAGWVRSRGWRLAGVACLVQSPFTRAGYVSPGHGRVIRLGSL